MDSNTLLKAGHSTANTCFFCHITQDSRENRMGLMQTLSHKLALASPEENRSPQRTLPALLSRERSPREQGSLHKPPCGITYCCLPLEGGSTQSFQNQIPDELSPRCHRVIFPHQVPPSPAQMVAPPPSVWIQHTHLPRDTEAESASCSSVTVCLLLCNTRGFDGSCRSTEQRLISQLLLQRGRTLTRQMGCKRAAMQRLLKKAGKGSSLPLLLSPILVPGTRMQ